MATGINRDRARGKSKGRGTGDDITQSTTEGNAKSSQSSGQSPQESNRGRPRTIENPHRTTVTLEEYQVDHLDRICAQIKLSGGENLSRSNVIRALLDALTGSEIEYSDIRSEAKLRELFQESIA
jgi:hypothetical protein